MEIYICELAPSVKNQTLDVKVNNFNSKLTDWSEHNGVKIINTNLQFRLATSDIDQMCYQTMKDSEDYLNRLGTIRLLNVISSQCPVFNLHRNWDDIMSRASSDFLRRNSFNHFRNYNRNIDKGNRSQSNRVTYQQQSHQMRESYPYSYALRQPYINRAARHNHHANPHRQSAQNRRPSADGLATNLHNPRNSRQENQSHHQPCYNCGETNHNLSICHHKFRI